MPTVTSKDGTPIAFDRSGTGPAVLLVDGALCSRSFGPMGPLAAQLTPHFTVYTYDRRGRGDSGDTQPFAVEREIEDIEAFINEAGGSTFVYGISSGAALAFEAARMLPTKITKLALYEPPYTVDPDRVQGFNEYRVRLTELLAEGRKGDAVELMMRLVGAGDEGVARMRQAPIWPLFEAVAPTLAYDAAALGDSSVPTDRAASVTIPTLVMAGGATFPFIRQAAQALAGALPHAQHRELEGQTHEVAAEALAPVLTEFFAR
ncbi:MAG TPA: alpha/beta hydrolase [Ktedonobacterales bacterium]|nr:alpha/beta hydrolase [Ktedonobacterales bacterium]